MTIPTVVASRSSFGPLEVPKHHETNAPLYAPLDRSITKKTKKSNFQKNTKITSFPQPQNQATDLAPPPVALLISSPFDQPTDASLDPNRLTKNRTPTTSFLTASKCKKTAARKHLQIATSGVWCQNPNQEPRSSSQKGKCFWISKTRFSMVSGGSRFRFPTLDRRSSRFASLGSIWSTPSKEPRHVIDSSAFCGVFPGGGGVKMGQNSFLLV